MKFTFKKNVVPDVATKEVDGAVVYLVGWDARYGEYSSCKKRVAKGFLNKKDVDEFVESLKNAQALLHYTEDLNITIEEQQ